MTNPSNKTNIVSRWTALSTWFDSSNTPSVAEVKDAIDQKTKPPGSLGQIELVAAQLALLQGTLTPLLDSARVLVFAADHGITVEGVSAYPAAVTAQMMANFASGGAAVCVLSASNNMAVEVIDVGVDNDLSQLEGIVHAKVANGTQNFSKTAAMTPKECDAALAVGRDAVQRAIADGVQCVGLGEMGIGNTTSAAAILALLLNKPVAEVTGRGTGADDQMLQHKIDVIQQAVEFHSAHCDSSLSVLQRVGGLEIAAICGAIAEASEHNLPVIVDGFISTAAALVAVRSNPVVQRALFFSHQSAEAGHRHALEALDAEPLLSLGMRLGEGSATALAYPLLRTSANMLSSMSTFADAGVSERTDGNAKVDEC